MYRRLFPALCLAAAVLGGCAHVERSAQLQTGARYHRLEKGETLYALSQRYGVDVGTLMKVNGITDPTSLPVGTLIYVPAPTAPAPERTLSAPQCREDVVSLVVTLAPGVVESGRWRYVVIHHSGTHEGNADIFEQGHIRRGMKNGLAYHFVIDNGTSGRRDGQIEVGRRWLYQLDGGHVASSEMNRVGIGICLVGNFQDERPTQAQLNSLVELVVVLCRRYRIPVDRVVGHGEINSKPTLCPGRLLDMDDLRARVAARL